MRESLLLPREKLKMNGAATLQVAELIAVIFGVGNKKKGIIELSLDIEKYLLNCESIEDLQYTLSKVDDVGEMNKLKVLALFQLLHVWQTQKRAHTTKKIQISTPEDVIQYFKSYFVKQEQELLLAIYLDTKNQVLACEKLFIGTIDSVEIHPREIFSYALIKKAKSIIIMHNHPSGNPKPSTADITTTKTLAQLGMTLGIPLIDHIIIAKEQFVSLKRDSYF